MDKVAIGAWGFVTLLAFHLIGLKGGILFVLLSYGFFFICEFFYNSFKGNDENESK